MKKFPIFFALPLLFLSNAAEAGKISAVKNNKVMMSLEGDSASAGTEFFVLNSQGKKVAIVRITQVKGDRAVGQITKGTAKPGYATQLKGGGGTTASGSSGSEASDDGAGYYEKKLSQRDHNGNSYGFVGGYLMNTMSINASGLNTNMTGSGFAGLGFYDHALSSSLVVRAMVGLEQYVAKGANSAASPSGCLTDCNVNLTYLSMYGYGRWNYLPGKYKGWLGGGIGYLYPMAKSSTAFSNTSQLQANQIFMFSAGMDVRLSRKTYIPISVEYGMFPSSSTVTANIIYLRAGYAWNL